MARIIKNNLGNFYPEPGRRVLVILVIFSLVTGWWFSGFPRIWQKPAIPPEIREAQAITCGFGADIGGQCQGYLTVTGAGIWTIPTDWSNTNKIECIGAGGGSGTNPADGTGGGGGGAYAYVENLSGLSGNIDVSVGAGGAAGVNGGNTWFNSITCAGSSVCAGGGQTSPSLDEAAGPGGTVQVGTGFSGGSGGVGGDGSDDGGGGGGGAAGPGGLGKNGGGLNGNNGGGGGGGAGGNLSTAGNPPSGDTGGAGGQGPNETGGGAVPGGAGSDGGGGGGGTDVTSEPGGVGGEGREWLATPPYYGAGGGGGGGADAGAGANGGLYGGGGGGTGEDGTVNGSGAQGIIVITYTPANITVGTGGAQVANMNVNSSNNYVGGYFTFVRNTGTANVTQIIITDTGTVNANLNLANVDLYYEIAATCSYEGTETLFGTAASFSATEKATVTGAMAVGTSQVCVYAVLDVGSGAAADETIEIEISNPSTEVTVSAGTVSPATAVAIADATILQAAAISISRTAGDGAISYGYVVLNGTKNTGPGDLNDVETYQNTGGAAELFRVRTSTATGGATPWDPGAAIASNVFVHSFATTTGLTWQILDPPALTYETASSSVAVNATVDFYFKFDAPSGTTVYDEKTITLNIQAIAP